MISVIIPAYNEEKFIGRCLKSLLNQTLPREEYEIIVSDSSSKDKTKEIAKKYADKVVSCEKRGAGFTRNFGAKFAKGKFLAFIDADTVASRTWLEGVKESLNNGIASTGPIRALERDSFKLKSFYFLWSGVSSFYVNLKYPLFPGFNIGVRKKYFKKINGFSEKNIISEDYEFSLKLRKFGKIVFNSKMKVFTSTRRIKEKGIIKYILLGTDFLLFKNSKRWDEYRSDW